MSEDQGTDTQTEEAVEATQAEEAPAEPTPEPDASQEPADWRVAITNDDARKFAESSTDVNHLAERALDMRAKLSNAVIKPGENASDEDRATFNKAMGVPESVEGYEVVAPEHIGEEAWASDDVQGAVNSIVSAMHAEGVSKAGVDAALNAYWQIEAAQQQAQVDADAKYADENTAALKAKWDKDYDVNLEFSNRGMEYLFGDDVTVARELEMGNGRFLLDNPLMIEALARIGRETSEAGLGPTAMTQEGRESVKKEFDSLKKEQHEAYHRGDSAEANRLGAQAEALATKLGGDAPLVGAEGRAI